LAIWEDTMMENAPLVGSGNSASLLLGRKLDSIPFSIYHVQIILVLAVVGFVEGYDVALGGSLLVLAKEPLHLSPEQIRGSRLRRFSSSCSASFGIVLRPAS
jgi:hypothetical protein